jgi:hypothetical protein
VLIAAIRPLEDGMRAVGLEARKVSVQDILLAARLNERIDADMPISASMRAEIGSDGTLYRLQGQALVEEGSIVDRNGERSEFKVDSADIRFNWDAQQRTLQVPFQLQSSGNQFTLRAVVEAPADQSGIWLFRLIP